VPNPVLTDERVSVALLYQTSQLEGHLKEALKELGAAVVYEALTAQMDRDALEGSGAHVVIVNLDPEIESHLDEVYDLLDDERYNVVFNDAQVSSGLSGWEQARWSRHLAAKIMGRPEVTDPPRPPGAEAPPSPAQKLARTIPDVPQTAPPGHTFAPDAAAAALFSGDAGLNDALDALFSQDTPPAARTAAPTPPPPARSAPAAAAAPPPVPPAADFGFDFDELLGSGNDTPAAPPPAAPRPAAITLELPIPPGLAERKPAAGGLDLDLDFTAPPPASSKPAGLDLDLDLDFAAPPPAAAASPAQGFDLDLDLDFSAPPAPAAPAAADTGLDFDFDLGALDVPTATIARAGQPAAEEDFGFSTGDFGSEAFGDLDTGAPALVREQEAEPDFSFGAELDALFDTTPEAPAQASELVDFDAAFGGGAAAPAADPGFAPPAAPRQEKPAATAAPAARSFDLSKFSLEPLKEDDADEASPPPAAAKPESYGVEKLSAESFLSGGNWSLEELVEASDDDGAAAPPAAPVAVVEKVAAQDYLAPQGGDAAKVNIDTSLKLDLIPMEDAVSPEQDRSDFFVEHRLDGSAAVKPIRRVVVLGASIGGPEAVREYLAALPPRFPALFLLAQHMGAEFLELMAAQLAKATPLTVRAPGHGERVSQGEVIVVPTTHRLLIDADGVVQLAHLPEASPYTPSIDLVVKDIADRFGSAATAIVFSGMAHDAIEGAKHLAAKGGQVWVQDPDTCVISSMVDGARDAGVVTFTGSPAELAKHTIAHIGKA
jgi:CheB methylesterase